MDGKKKWVWVADDDAVWLPAAVTKDSGATKGVRLEDGRSLTLTRSKKEPLW